YNLSPNLPTIDKCEPAQRAIGAGYRHVRFEREVDAPSTTEGPPIDAARAEAAALETTHPADAADVVVLEERIRIATVAVAIAKLAVESERDTREKREVLLELISQTVVLQVHTRQTHLAEYALVATARWHQQIVAIVT